MCAHGARMAKFRRRTRRHRESLRNSLFNNRAFLLSVFRFFIARADEALSPASSRAFGTQTLVSEIAEQSGRRPGAPSPALHRQSRPVRRAIDRIAPIPSSRPRLRRPASGRAGTVNLSGSCRICPRDRKPNPGHRAGRWAKPVRPNAYFPRQPELPRSDAQPLPRDFSSHASRVLEYATTADAADR